jgi:HD-like signal output (HDOD) protein
VKRRILFVDDESAVLDGLRDLLRKERKRWDMAFANSGQAALEELSRAPADVVVSDMRMPGMDGATLLGLVKERYPATARIILSGHSDREAIFRALPVAHQFLSKPCDASALKGAIEDTCELCRILENGSIRSIVGKLERLPSVPRTYLALVEAASDRNAGLQQIGEIIEKDAAMSAKLLQLVNSAYFGSAQRLDSIGQAVRYLGVETLKALALSSAVFTSFDGGAVEGFSQDQFQRTSMAAAKMARRFLREPKRAEAAFTAGLLHDVGVLVLAQGVPVEYAEILREAKSRSVPEYALERERLGVSHAEIGAYLLGVWGLPASIVATVAMHHDTGKVTEPPMDLLAAVHAADALTSAQPEILDLDLIERAGFTPDLPRWREMATEEMANAALN